MRTHTFSGPERPQICLKIDEKSTFLQLPSKDPNFSAPDLLDEILGASGCQKGLQKQVGVRSQSAPKITTIPEILEIGHLAAPRLHVSRIEPYGPQMEPKLNQNSSEIHSKTLEPQREGSRSALVHPHSFASPARAHNTKRKRRRNESNIPAKE